MKKVKKDNRKDAALLSNLGTVALGEHTLVNAGYKEPEGSKGNYSWSIWEDSKGDQFMVGGADLDKMLKAGIISDDGDQYAFEPKAKFGYKNKQFVK